MNQMDIVLVGALLCYYFSYWHSSHTARSWHIILHMQIHTQWENGSKWHQWLGGSVVLFLGYFTFLMDVTDNSAPPQISTMAHKSLQHSRQWVSTRHHLANSPCFGTGWAGIKQYKIMENQLAGTTASLARTTAIFLQWAWAFLINWPPLLQGYQTISHVFIHNVVCLVISSPMSVFMLCTDISPQPYGDRACTAVKISDTKDCCIVCHAQQPGEGM
jgi:hypothetical protein